MILFLWAGTGSYEEIKALDVERGKKNENEKKEEQHGDNT